MPHNALKIVPGVDQTKTPTLNEAAISESQLVRFIPDRTLGGLVQKLGGWTKFFPNTIGSTIRALWAWEDTNANSYLAVGAEGLPAGAGGTLQIIESGGANDITPQKTTVNVAVSVSTTLGSNVVTITDTGRNADDFDVVDIQTQISVGGLVLFGQYQIFNPGGSANTYTILATDALGDPAYATATVSTAGSVSFYGVTTGSNFVNVTLADHGYLIGSTYAALVATSVGGITIYGNYIVVDVLSPDVFVISASSVAAPVLVTGASGDGTTVTITHSSSIQFLDGSTVTISGVDPAGYNGTWTVDSSASGSFTFLDSETGAFVSGGEISGEYGAYENAGNAHYVYYNGLGPVLSGTGYGIGGYGLGGYGTGITPTAGTGTPINATDWTLDNWGEVLIACPVDGPIYKWAPTSGDLTALIIPNAPSVNDGMFVAMPQRQIIAWGSTFTGVKDPLLIRWCDVNNYDQWIGQITNQAGSYRIPKGSRIVQCIQGPQQGLIWTDLALWAMQYAGPPYVYQFNEIGTGCGLIGRKAAASLGGVVYWMGPSQFYRLAGSGVEPIACPVWDVIFQDLDTNNLDKIRVAPNSRFGEITWYYPTSSNGGEVSHYVKYNVILNQWDFGTLARTAWINESVLGPPIGAAPNTYIYQHETSPDADGAPMTSYFQTGYFVLSEADVKMFVDQVWPDMKWGYYNGVQDANVLLTFYVADYPGDTPIPYGPYTLTQVTKYITPRFRGRLVSIRIESNDIGSWWRLGCIRYRYQPDGKY
jgi:hypothetical protein